MKPDSPFVQAAHGQATAPEVFPNCSFSTGTAVARQPSDEPRYSAVNITVPSDIERANSWTTPTPKPFLDQAYAVPPLSEGQQLRARLLASHADTAPGTFSRRTSDMLFSTAPPGGATSAAQGVEANTVASETASEHALSGVCTAAAVALHCLMYFVDFSSELAAYH